MRAGKNAPMLRVAGLRKRFGDLVAVDGLDLAVPGGEIAALLGPNGAGKSTAIGCIVGLLDPDDGTIEVAGVDARRDPAAARARIGYVPEVANLYEALTSREFLALKGRLFDVAEAAIADRTERLLSGFDLWERRDDALGSFSKGMLQRVSLASALLVEPRLLVLDEPHSGLDVETSLVLKEVIRGFARRGGAVLYCSHLLDVVETMADRVIVIDRGRALAAGTLAELRSRTGADAGERLEALFQTLTQAADPAARAERILGVRTDRP